MSDNTVSFKIKITGSDGIKEAEVSVQNLGKAFTGAKGDAESLSKALANSDRMVQALEEVASAVKTLKEDIQKLTDLMGQGIQSATQKLDSIGEGTEKLRDSVNSLNNDTDKLRNSLINSNQAVQAFEQMNSAVQGLQTAMHGLADIYAVQAQAETRLSTVMRNTMDATEADIQAIKNLASAQQELGVIGDEVQLSGAQELATYLGQKESLEKLIPVMNDMIAQQYGYTASAESAVGIATMMGKVMEGQTEALSRYGYSFTEAQKQILKFGTEEERAATLAEVIEESVGGVNAALAATDYGKIVQANNKLGDMKEQLGAIVAPAMTAVDKIASISIAFAGIGKGIATLKSLHTTLKSLTVATKLQEVATKMLGKAGITAAAGTNTLKIAVIGLQAAISFGLFAAVQGLVWLFGKLDGAIKGAKNAKEEFAKASEEARAQFDSETSALQGLIGTIQDENAARADQVEAIAELEEKYPDLVAKYIDEQGHITNLIGLQRELNRLRAGERFRSDREKLEEYKSELEKWKKWQKAATVPGVIDPVGRTGKLFYIDKKVEYWETMVNEQQAQVERNKATEWKARLKDSTREELDRMLEDTRKLGGDWGGTGAGKQSKIADIEAEIASRESAKPTENKAYWEDVRKKKQAEYDAIPTQELGSQKALTLKGEIEEATAKIDSYKIETHPGKTGKKENEAYKAEIQAAEKAQREKETALKNQYLLSGDKEAYDTGMEAAAIEGLEAQKAIAEKYGQDTTKIEQSLIDARIQQRENEYNRKLALLNEASEQEMDCLKEQLENNEITRKEYDLKTQQEEQWNNQLRLKLAEEYGKDTADILRDQHERGIRIEGMHYEAEAELAVTHYSSEQAILTRQLADGLLTQEQYDRQMLEEKVKYYRQLLDLDEAYNKSNTGNTQAWLDARIDLRNFDQSAADKKAQKTGTPLKNAGDAWSGLKGVAGSIRDIKSAIEDTDNAWDALTRTVDGFIGAVKNVTSVIEAIKNITEATRTMAQAKTMATARFVAGNAEESASELASAGVAVSASGVKARAARTEATANAAAAVTGAGKSVASIPWVGAALAVAAIASVIASLARIPKFANGAIVYGPTVGLMGEYPGASGNPEVIAPLSKLQGLLGGGMGRQEVRFRIEGRELVGILNKQNNIYQRNS